jgi:hypothetical protein
MTRNSEAEIGLSLEDPRVARGGSLQSRVWRGCIEKGLYKRNPVALRQLHKFILADGSFGGFDHGVDEKFGQGAPLNFSRSLA